MKKMNKEEFYNYIQESFEIYGNILCFVEDNYSSDAKQQFDVLDALLDGTIGLTEDEIRKVQI